MCMDLFRRKLSSILLKIKFRHSILVLSVLILYSCGSSSNDGLLNFLFDGVPIADTLKTVDQVVTKNDTSTSIQNQRKILFPVLVLHEPYKEKMCESCHDIKASYKKIMSLPELCYQCHQDFQSTYKNVHYPVEAGECNSCHHPHQTELPKLLLNPVRNLCAECHDLNDLLAGDIHNGIGETVCTDCHNPHGSNESFLLN